MLDEQEIVKLGELKYVVAFIVQVICVPDMEVIHLFTSPYKDTLQLIKVSPFSQSKNEAASLTTVYVSI